MVKKRMAYSVLVGKLEQNRSSRRPLSRWKNYINMNLEEIGWKGAE